MSQDFMSIQSLLWSPLEIETVGGISQRLLDLDDCCRRNLFYRADYSRHILVIINSIACVIVREICIW